MLDGFNVTGTMSGLEILSLGLKTVILTVATLRKNFIDQFLRSDTKKLTHLRCLTKNRKIYLFTFFRVQHQRKSFKCCLSCLKMPQKVVVIQPEPGDKIRHAVAILGNCT